jgi:hypothetical protein
MTEPEIQPAAEPVPGLSQWQRVTNTFAAPSKTFEDIKRGNKSWWLPLILMVLAFLVFFLTITTRITWHQVYENEQRNLPEFAKRMQEQAPPERQAAAAKAGPITQAVTAAIAPVGVLLLDVIAAAVLLATINFGFGGKATFSSLFTVTLYAGLPLWVLRWLLGALTAFFTDPEAFNIHNASPTNVAAFLPDLRTSSLVLYNLLMSIDALGLWCMVVTSIGVATVAGTKRSSGYIAVFLWWFIGLLIGVGMAAAFG